MQFEYSILIRSDQKRIMTTNCIESEEGEIKSK